jgi:hypothetical protein
LSYMLMGGLVSPSAPPTPPTPNTVRIFNDESLVNWTELLLILGLCFHLSFSDALNLIIKLNSDALSFLSQILRTWCCVIKIKSISFYHPT